MALGIAMSIAGCECEGAGPPLTRLAADIEVMPTTLDFGETSLGTVKQLPVSVRNTGDDRLRICLQLSDPTETNGCTEISSIEPQDAPFSTVFEQLSDKGNWFVDRGMERQFLIQFAPLMEGSYEGKFIIHHNGLSGPTAEITFTGTGVKPVVNFDTNALDFGDVTVNKRKTLSFTLTNGTQFPQPIVIPPVQQTAVIFGTENNGEITLEGETLQTTLEGNSTLTINVWYSPPEEGAHIQREESSRSSSTTTAE